jgi:hypothetical protein
MDDMDKVAAMAAADQSKAFYNENIDRAIAGFDLLLEEYEMDRMLVTSTMALILYSDPEYSRMVLTSELAVAIDRLQLAQTEIKDLKERVEELTTSGE